MISIDDIEDKQLKEKILLEMQEMDNRVHFTEILNDANIDQVLAYDIHKRVTSCNKTCEIKWGIIKGKVIGKNLLESFPSFTNSNAVVEAIDLALAGFKVFVPHDKGRYDEGYYEHHFIPLKDENEKVMGAMIIIHDVAHRIKAENELKQLNKALVKKNKELKQKNAEVLAFSHVTSHELKEPLHKIYSFIEMLLRDEAANLSDKGKFCFKRIQATVQRMGLLSDDMLAYYTLNKTIMQQEELNLNHTLLIAKHNLAEQIAETDTRIDAAELPSVRGYRSMLTQLFQNIISNAIKFCKPGVVPHIRIDVSQEKGNTIKHIDALPDTMYYKIYFRDNGIGFDPKHSERIFRMFERLHRDTYPGNGIGLANCKKICELHQGFITAQSIPGEGSTFDCFLPVQ